MRLGVVGSDLEGRFELSGRLSEPALLGQFDATLVSGLGASVRPR